MPFPFAALLDEVLRAKLPALDLEQVRPRRWVSRTKGPVRKIFEFQAMKGARYSACWGFSLDFVPVLRRRRLRWKRTSKSAEFDLCIDPIDQAERVPAWCSFVHSPVVEEARPQDVIWAAKNAAYEAQNDFGRVNSVADLIGIFRERASMSFRRFSLENYVQTHIAWGLALIAIGEAEEGEVHLGRFCERYGIDRNERLIKKAEAEAVGDMATARACPA